jgi:NAD(P)-dependent dehydrogenase (short-subunit alcohol dehydrogenase family)
MSKRKTVFITGGSRGIGASLVVHAARHGYNVAFTYNSDKKGSERVTAAAQDAAPEGLIKAYQLDVKDSARVDEVADEVLGDFDNVWGVVANAGISINELAYSVTDEHWREVIDTNLSGSFFVSRAFLPELVANKGGRIILISSVTAPGASGQVAYAASKSGLVGVAGTLAREYGKKGITTNVISPGYFETDMTRDGVSDDKKEFANRFGPLGRAGELEELAGAVMYLLSDSASYVNGANLPVTGGLDWVP